jgi:hypothetical protein
MTSRFSTTPVTRSRLPLYFLFTEMKNTILEILARSLTGVSCRIAAVQPPQPQYHVDVSIFVKRRDTCADSRRKH